MSQKDDESVKGQLQKPEEIDWSWLHNNDGITLLHAACHIRHIGVFEVAVARRPLLLRAQIGPAGSHQGETPLHFLVKGGQAAESAEEEEQAWGPQCHVPACFGFKGGCAEAAWRGFGPQEIMRALEPYLHSLRQHNWAHVLGRVTAAQHETVFHHAVKPPAKPAVLQRLLQFGFEAQLNMGSILKQRNKQEPPKRAVTRVVFLLGGEEGRDSRCVRRTRRAWSWRRPRPKRTHGLRQIASSIWSVLGRC